MEKKKRDAARTQHYHTHPAHHSTPHRPHHAYTPPTGTHTRLHTRLHTPPTHRLQERTQAYTQAHTQAYTRLHTHAQAPTGACRRGLGERHPSVTTPETTCDHQPCTSPLERAHTSTQRCTAASRFNGFTLGLYRLSKPSPMFHSTQVPA